MHKINIFYHVFCVNNWQELCEDQFANVFKSGLYDACEKMRIGVVGNEIEIDKFFTWFPEMIKKYTPTNKIEMRSSTENHFEYLTIHWLKEFCDTNDAHVLYFHTKGISQPAGSFIRLCKDDWRKFMEYECIEKWKYCDTKLDEGYDCCGTRFSAKKHVHFSGNFWWAKSSWIKTLPIVASNWRRINYEQWLLRGCRVAVVKPKILPLSRAVVFNTDFRFPPEKYRTAKRAY